MYTTPPNQHTLLNQYSDFTSLVRFKVETVGRTNFAYFSVQGLSVRCSVS